MNDVLRPAQQIPMIGGFESTYLPAFDVDVAEATGHIERRRADLALLRACGVRRLRYPVRWHRVAPTPQRLDWSETDAVMELLDELELEPILDLVHHTSYPRWLKHGFADRRFPDAYLRYVEAFVTRYPNVREYTVFNEPFSTLLLCGHEGAWPPHGRGVASFVALLANVLPAIAAASRLCRQALPDARHVWVDSCERHTGAGRGAVYAEYANDRRFFVLDAIMGRIESTSGRPFVVDVVSEGARSLLELEPSDIDVVGLDYYAHCQWHFGPQRGSAPTHVPPPLAELIVEYANRYGRPCMVSESNIRGTGSDRATWLKYLLEQCERAVEAGVDLRGLCWFPFVDSCDWDSLLQSCRGSIDPVGVVSLDERGQRMRTAVTESFIRAAAGVAAADLPAYELQDPVATWLRGYRLQMAEWSWSAPPRRELVRFHGRIDADYRPLGAVTAMQ